MVADPLRTAADVLADAADITLLAHVQPDADSLGSALALGIALRRRGAVVRVAFATPDEMPDTLRPLDVLGLVVPPRPCPRRRTSWWRATPLSPPGSARWPPRSTPPASRS